MDIKNLMLNLNQRPVAVYPIYIELFNSLTAGYLFSQLMYWCSAVGGREFYKVDAELMEETKLSINEYKRAKAIIKAAGFVTITVKGIPAKSYYKIDLHKLAEAIADIKQTDTLKSSNLLDGIQPTGWMESNQLDGWNPTNYVDGIQPTNTETTQRLTSQTTPEREVPNLKKTTNKIDQFEPIDQDAGQDTLNAQNVKEKKKSGEKEKKADGRTILRDESFIGEMEDFAGKYINVKYEMDKMADYIASSGKQYKDYKAFARNWIRRAMEGKQKEYEAKQPTAIVSRQTYNEVRERLKAKYGDKYTFND